MIHTGPYIPLKGALQSPGFFLELKAQNTTNIALYMYMYVYTYICHIYTCHIYIYAICIYIYICMPYIYMPHIYICHICIYIYIYVCHIYIYVYMPYIYIYIWPYHPLFRGALNGNLGFTQEFSSDPTESTARSPRATRRPGPRGRRSPRGWGPQLGPHHLCSDVFSCDGRPGEPARSL